MQLRSFCLVITLVLMGLSLCAQEPAATPAPMDGILLRPNIWEAEKLSLEPDLTNLRFEWISADQDLARSSLPGLAFNKHSLNEAILSFRNGKLAEATRAPCGRTNSRSFLQALPPISTSSPDANRRTGAGTRAAP